MVQPVYHTNGSPQCTADHAEALTMCRGGEPGGPWKNTGHKLWKYQVFLTYLPCLQQI